MNLMRTLTVLTVLSVVLMSIHISDDMARGFDSVGVQNVFGIVILGAWAYGALALQGRRSGYILQLLGGVFGVGVLVLHLNGKGLPTLVRSSGGLFYYWVLLTLGTTSFLALVLSVQGLWSLRRGARSAG
jgi:hypothetical protein